MVASEAGHLRMPLMRVRISLRLPRKRRKRLWPRLKQPRHRMPLIRVRKPLRPPPKWRKRPWSLLRLVHLRMPLIRIRKPLRRIPHLSPRGRQKSGWSPLRAFFLNAADPALDTAAASREVREGPLIAVEASRSSNMMDPASGKVSPSPELAEESIVAPKAAASLASVNSDIASASPEKAKDSAIAMETIPLDTIAPPAEASSHTGETLTPLSQLNEEAGKSIAVAETEAGVSQCSRGVCGRFRSDAPIYAFGR